ncbi:MAG: ATP-binding protein [Naasia sp.]
MIDPVTLAFVVLAVLAILVVVFAGLWLAERRRGRARSQQTSAEARDRIDLELSVADQGGRLRIIRELHDLNIARVSALVRTAEGARYSGERNPQAAVRAASTMADSARAVLADMRRVSSLVHESEAEALPQPTLTSTRDLFALMRDAGLTVSFEEAGRAFPVTPAAELGIYRILQEALTNALKYGGGGTQVRVGLTWTEQGLQVRIDDDGTRNAAAHRGLDPDEATAYTVEEDLRSLTESIVGPGLEEMRERTELFGGVFSATQTPGVGFSVSAVFPTLRHHNGVHGVDLSRGVGR